MKLTVIGGGGVRSLFLAKSIAQKAEQLHITTLVLMDNDPEKLYIYGKMAAHTAHLLCPAMEVILTQNAEEAITDADYVITTIREGGDHMRIRDERIALNHGVLGQETTGAAGFSFAMRSVQALREYCELVRRCASPGCKVFNFTNPAGVVSQTLRDMGYDFTYGICDAPSGMLRSFASLLGVSPDTITGEVYGLNHLSYFTSVKAEGKEVMPEIIGNDEAYRATDLRYFERALLEERGAILNEYLYYFYYREQALEHILAAKQTRGEQIGEINEKMTAALKEVDIDHDFQKALRIFEYWYGERENNYMASETGIRRTAPWHFDLYSEDGSGYAGVALKYMEIKQSGQSAPMILCTANEGAIPTLRDDDVVEITCDITKDGVMPHRFPHPDEQNLELIRRVKIYERLASEAIRKKSIRRAVEALTLHPLVNSYSLAKKLIGEYLALNHDYTKDWR